jgi:hypothetical protein
MTPGVILTQLGLHCGCLFLMIQRIADYVGRSRPCISRKLTSLPALLKTYKRISKFWLSIAITRLLFTTSKQILFAFRCDEGEPFQVQFRLQGKMIKLSGCANDEWGLCDWSVVKMKHGNISAACNLDFSKSKQHKYLR